MGSGSSGQPFETNLGHFPDLSLRLRGVEPQVVDDSEKDEWFARRRSPQAQVLFVCGLGQGAYYEAAKEWLNFSLDHYLVFIEDQLPVLRAFLETGRAAEILHHPRVTVHFLEEIEPLKALCEYFVYLEWEVTPSRHSAQTRPDWIAGLQQLIDQEMWSARADAYQNRNMNREWFSTIYPNVARMGRDLSGNHLFGQFKKVPAIICGAGPSLSKQIPFLEEAKKHALLLSAGSALTALTRAGVQPHLAAGISRHRDEIHRFWHSQGYEIPLLYGMRTHPEALELVHGPRLYVKHGAGLGFLHHVEEKLGIEGEPIEEGTSVTDYLTEIAYHLGCDPIIYVGVDLALTGAHAYAHGVVTDPEIDPDDEEVLVCTDIYGKPTHTYQKWIYESSQLSQLIARCAGPRYLNGTEGGIGIAGAEVVSLQEALKLCPAQKDLSGRLHALLAEAEMPQVTKEGLHSLLDKFSVSVERCMDLADQMSEELTCIEQRLAARIKAGLQVDPIEPPPWLCSGMHALIEQELHEEIAYRVVFSQMIELRDRAHRRIHDQFAPGIQNEPLLLWHKELVMEQERYRFLADAAEENLALIEKSL